MTIITIAKDQAADLIRRRYLIVILIGGLALIGMWMGYVAFVTHFVTMSQHAPAGSPGQAMPSKAMQDIMVGALQAALYGLISSVAVLLALGLMSFSVMSEVSKGTVRMILSRPVKRYEFFIGKWLGCTAIVFAYVLLTGGLAGVYTRFAIGSLQPIVWIAIAMLFLKAIMVGSIGMALSMYLRPIIGLLIAYLAAGETFLFIAKFLHGVPRTALHLLFYVLPSYKAFDQYKSIFLGGNPSATDIAYRAAYAILVIALMLIVGSSAFQRKDLV